MMQNEKNVVIVLAGGRGSRMKSKVKKQYMEIAGKPLLWYSLQTFEKSPLIDEVVLVCGAGEEEECRRNFVAQYGFSKIKKIVAGGKERYHSVYEGLKAIESCDHVFIHDGARPFVDEHMIERVLLALKNNSACVVGMPVKDTIKLSDGRGYVAQTLPRERLWTIQTPQAFDYRLIRKAYEELMSRRELDVIITDDAMVAEYILGIPVKLIEGSYNNIKITTQEDCVTAEAIAQKLAPADERPR